VSELGKLDPELQHVFIMCKLLLLNSDAFVHGKFVLVGFKLHLKMLGQVMTISPCLNFGPLHFGRTLHKHRKVVFGDKITDHVLRVTTLLGGLLAHKVGI
jgi:uncharacterized membrane protein